MSFSKLIDDIISVSSAVRYVMVADDDGRLLDSKSVTRSFLKNEDQGKTLATDMRVLKQLLKLYDEMVGRNTFTYLVRENVHVLIFYPSNFVILVSCDRHIARHEVMDISEKIDSIIKKLIV